MSKLRAWAVRTMWSGVSAVLGSMSGAAVFDVTAWKAAALAGVTTVMSALLVYARAQADRLPEVGR